MIIPSHCSFRDKRKDCLLPPSYLIVINDEPNEYMIGVVCEEHREVLHDYILTLQNKRKIMKGKIVFKEVKMVGTDCIKGGIDDLQDIEFKRSY